MANIYIYICVMNVFCVSGVSNDREIEKITIFIFGPLTELLNLSIFKSECKRTMLIYGALSMQQLWLLWMKRISGCIWLFLLSIVTPQILIKNKRSIYALAFICYDLRLCFFFVCSIWQSQDKRDQKRFPQPTNIFHQSLCNVCALILLISRK